MNISAVIPLYNGAAYIGDALASVMTQTCLPIEVVVVDDGSTDDGAGAEIVRAYQRDTPLPVHLLHKENGGQSSARNFGISEARGTLIALLDQDDYWYPEHLEVLAGAFDNNGHVGLSYGDLDTMDDVGSVVVEHAIDHLHSIHPKRNLADCLGKNMYILPSASLMSKRAWEEAGGFDERLSGYEDDDLFLRIWSHYDVVYLDQPVSRWRIHAVSSSWTPRMWESGLVYAEKLIAEHPDDPGLSQYYVRDYIAPRFFRYYLSVYNSLVEKGDMEYVGRVHGAVERFGRLMKPSLEVNGILFLARYPRLFSRTYGVARGLRRMSSRGRNPLPCA
ncbi:MAG: glycosyltransferase family 2 protein [Acidimicrobiales bacterium]